MNKLSKIALAITGIAFHGLALSEASDLSAERARCLALNNINQAESCLRDIDTGFIGRVAQSPDGRNILVDQPASITGEFSEYLGGSLDGLRSPLLARALENEGRDLVVNVGSPDPKTGEYHVRLTTKSDKQPENSGAIFASNTGAEITGQEIGSWYNRSRMGNGYVLVSSLNYGFADFHKKSRDGKYEAAYLSLERANHFGLFEAQYLYSVNEPGGESRIYDLEGKTNRYTLAMTNWLTHDITLKNQISHTRRTQDFGVFGIDEKQEFWSYKPSLTYSGHPFSTSLTLNKGLGGKRDYDLIPLMGAYDPNFFSVQLDASHRASLPHNIKINTKVSLFDGSKDMPSSERFRLGGDGAGSSHENGIYTGYKGFNYDITGTRYLGNYKGIHFMSELGANGARITTATDHKLAIDAIEGGFSAHYKNYSLSVMGSKSVSTVGIDSDSRINAELSWRY